MSSKMNSRDDLIRLYWYELRSETQIMYMLDYTSSNDVIADLIEYNIPLRAPDRLKIGIDVMKQSNNTTNLWGSKLQSDGQSITTETIDIHSYNQFYLFYSFSKTGDPTGAYIQMTIQYRRNSYGSWITLRDSPWNSAYETNNTIPVTGSMLLICPGEEMRINFNANGTNLGASNYFIINEIGLESV